MKIGVFADVHNNAVALDAVLRTLEDEGCEVLACAGDIIGIGPWPEETVQRLMRIPNLIAVRGNHERYLLEGMPATYPNDEGMDEAEMAYHRWEHSRLSAASVAFLRALPDRADLEAHDRRIAVMHYGMDRDRRLGPFTPHPDEDDLRRLFPDAQDAVLYGHDHARSIRRSGKTWFVNCGALGCPGAQRNIARAAVLDIAPDGRMDVRSIDIPYDVARVLDEIARLDYPAASDIRRFFFGVG